MAESNFSEILLRITGALFYSVPILIFILIAIYYITKAGMKTEGILILIGNILILLVSISHHFLYTFIESWGYELYSYISMGINAISFIGSILFIIGFLMIIQQNIKKQ